MVERARLSQIVLGQATALAPQLQLGCLAAYSSLEKPLEAGAAQLLDAQREAPKDPSSFGLCRVGTETRRGRGGSVSSRGRPSQAAPAKRKPRPTKPPTEPDANGPKRAKTDAAHQAPRAIATQPQPLATQPQPLATTQLVLRAPQPIAAARARRAPFFQIPQKHTQWVLFCLC